MTKKITETLKKSSYTYKNQYVCKKYTGAVPSQRYLKKEVKSKTKPIKNDCFIKSNPSLSK